MSDDDRLRRPSTMARDAFVARFGGVFEHSPWVAVQAFDAGLSPSEDDATGLHDALCRVFRTAPRDDRLGVLTAHPDLAGKLAAAKRLTESSTAEQAAAGLDALTDAERARFETLNTRYRERFGFPFVMAVKGRSKSEILAAFEVRIANDAASEFETACREVERIALLRLKDLLPR